MLNLELRQATKRDPSLIPFLGFVFFFKEVNTSPSYFRKCKEVVVDICWAQIPFSGLVSQWL